jgi:hypothetical protein
MKRTLLSLFATAILLFFFSHCVVPFESARMLPKGSTEIKGSFTHVRYHEEGENDKLNDGYGLGLGYGVTDRFNVKIRYERISTEGDVNYFAFGPKLALMPNRIAALLPFGVYFAEGESTWGMHPTLLFNLTKPAPKFEASIGLRGDIFFESNADVLLATNLGFGFSQNLDRWAIRPDIGFVFNPGESGVIITFGLGAQYNIASGRQLR